MGPNPDRAPTRTGPQPGLGPNPSPPGFAILALAIMDVTEFLQICLRYARGLRPQPKFSRMHWFQQSQECRTISLLSSMVDRPHLPAYMMTDGGYAHPIWAHRALMGP